MVEVTNEFEAELLEATGQTGRKKGETGQKYRARIAKAANKLPDDDWAALDDESQSWVNAACKALNSKTDIPAFPSSDVEDDLDEEDDELEDEDEEELEEEYEDEDEEDEDEEDEDGEDEDGEDEDDEEELDEDVELEDTEDDADDSDDEEEPAKPERKSKVATKKKTTKKKASTKKKATTKKETAGKKASTKKKSDAKAPSAPRGEGGTSKLREMVCKHLNWTKEKCREALDKDGVEMSDATLSTTYHSTRATIGILDKLGKLK